MNEIYDQLTADIERVNKIPIVPTMLEVICRTTGMGFAAIARVTEERWIACSVRDEIAFGLETGGELQIETTICDEIRNSREPVVIDHVDADEKFCRHHTPKMYGFQSYISMPIILNTGEFFGTLCAIDPKPAKVNDLKVTGMFTLFAQLIAFHLQALELLERNHASLHESNKKLSEAERENKRYEHLTYHSLREPLRKISLYSDMLLQESETAGHPKIRKTAEEIYRFSQQFASMLRQMNN